MDWVKTSWTYSSTHENIMPRLLTVRQNEGTTFSYGTYMTNIVLVVSFQPEEFCLERCFHVIKRIKDWDAAILPSNGKYKIYH